MENKEVNKSDEHCRMPMTITRNNSLRLKEEFHLMTQKMGIWRARNKWQVLSNERNK